MFFQNKTISLCVIFQDIFLKISTTTYHTAEKTQQKKYSFMYISA